MLASMKSRGLGVLALILGAIFLESAGHGLTPFLMSELRDQGETMEAISSASMLIALLDVGAPLAGGVVAFRAGPRVTAVAGLVIAAMGHAATALAAPVLVGAAGASLGGGIFGPCAFVIGAEVLARQDDSPGAPSPDRFSAVAAFAVAADLASQLGRTAALFVGGSLHGKGGSTHVANATLTMFAALLAARAVVLARADRADHAKAKAGPYRAAQPQDPGPSLASAPFRAIGMLLLIEAVAKVGTTVSVPRVPFPAESWVSLGTALAGFVVLGFVSGLLVTAAVKRWSRPPLHLYGVGLVVLALGLYAIACDEDSSVALYVAGSAFTGFGKTVGFAVPIAYVAMAVRGRAAALVVAGWEFAFTLMGTGAGVVAGLDPPRTLTLVVCGMLTLGAGAAFVTYAREAHDRFFTSPRTRSDPEASPP
jgi:hypothetical protein